MAGRGSGNVWDDRSRAINEILARTYEATSSDGRVTVQAVGEARVQVAHVDLSDQGNLSVSATEAVQDSLDQARVQTARAMAELPGLNPQLRALLLGGL